jgi:hypothetical protein
MKTAVKNCLTKVFKDDNLKEDISGELNLSGAKNEYVWGQVVLIPGPGEKIRGIKTEVTDLINTEKNDVIKKENIKCYVCGYVETKNATTYNVERVGWHPDALFPTEAPYDSYSGSHLTDSDPQPVWILVHTPSGINPGKYSGKITLTSGKSLKSEIVLNIHIWDFILPSESPIDVCISLCIKEMLGGFNHFYPEDKFDREHTLKKFYRCLAEHGINSTLYDDCYKKIVKIKPDGTVTDDLKGPGTFSFDFELMDKYLKFLISIGYKKIDVAPFWAWGTDDEYYLNYDMNPFLVEAFGKLGWSNKKFRLDYEDTELRNFMSDILTTTYKHLKEKGWLDKTYLYLWDEPLDEFTLNSLKKWAKLFKKLSPELPILVAGTIGAKKVGSEYVDITCPLLQDIGETKVDSKQELWGYTCTNNLPNIFIDYPLSCQRTAMWQCWKHKVEGFLYWNSIAWNIYWVENQGRKANQMDLEKELPLKFMEKNWRPEPEKRWPMEKWDTFTFAQYNGDGYLMYPDSDIPEIDEPVSTVRFEAFRDGIQDYKYMVLLKEEIERLKHNETAKESTKLIDELINKIVPTIQQFSRDPEAIYDARKRIAEQIEKCKRIK